MRILFLSDNFHPETNAPASRLYEHAQRWVRAGHQVTVITCAPNFPEGRLFPGYRNAWRSVEVVEGIRVVRVKTYITANEGFLKRTLDYLSFMVAGFAAGLFERRPDVVVATSPQFFCALGGWALAAVRRLPFVFELRDLWPASIMAVGAMQKNLAIRTLERIELFLYRRADAVIAVTWSFREDLISRGIEPNKIKVVINGVDMGQFRPITRDAELEREHALKNRLVLGYLGTHGMAHALESVIDAAEMLRERQDIAFLFVGGGAERIKVEQLVAEKGLSNVRLIPRQPKEMMPRLWSLCDVSLVPLRNTPTFSTVIPSKIFESMGMGAAILISLPEGEATAIIRHNDCGMCVPPENAMALAAAIITLADDRSALAKLKQNSASAAASYSRDALAQQMAEILETVATSHSI
jgi:colanic acid biosynthesis glycosyl transferase WcaI